jgi:ribosomal protein L5
MMERVERVKVEIKKSKKGTKMKWVVGVKVEVRKSKAYDFFEKENKKIRGPTRSEVRTSTVPRQRRQKACWVF